MSILSRLIIPVVVLGIIYNGLKNKVLIYDSFLNGAKDGLITVFNIAPAILAMVFAINVFLNSGVVNILLCFFKRLRIPLEIISMALLRPISGTASLAVLNDILIKYGADSYWGLLGSVLQGCTDTTIYVLALYFGSIHISKTKYALPVGLFADLIGITSAFILVKLFFGI